MPLLSGNLQTSTGRSFINSLKAMGRSIYLERMSFSRYDDRHVIAYLNEEEVADYVPEDAPEDFAPVMAYAYTGTESDGGTLIEAADDSRDSLVNGIIRTRYSQTEEDAIKTHQIIRLSEPDNAKSSDYETEWSEFNGFRTLAISTVDSWLDL